MIKIFKIFLFFEVISNVLHYIFYKNSSLSLAFFMGTLVFAISTMGVWAFSRIVLGFHPQEGRKASQIVLGGLASFKLFFAVILIYLALVLWRLPPLHFAGGMVAGLSLFLLAAFMGKPRALQ